ncbi:hypothetical protein FHR83_003714 [Actinoplanes campanulatus]|uniref:DUF4287 domain-containing protein n=1 Tax=Actinoplanes campanulatus TaxID=113559 RepID=A0A7W5AHX1_9ACTN|nr:hypothetical protein [Actinoplanes campanulatus]MBB3096044.1 hypothetical protein [Actinoplanes campanulatus]GGN13305.1 hypothetical protein GCM10010109_24280 [Actinoplanes campanulatus]GID36862.1 hypothetical protein Aca09nite_33680 [Actinoplanes campanulatus]
MATNARIKPIETATSRRWDDWLTFLAGIGAADLDHRAIAARVHEELDATGIDSPGWWAQSVTVAYEQHIGRRLPGQRSDGTFEVSVSRSTRLGMAALMDAWTGFAAADPHTAGLLAAPPRVSGTERRITWRVKTLHGTAIVVTSEPKTNGTASLVATETGLPSPESAAEARQTWTDTVTRFLESAAAR